jgi:hypothetical protein
VRFVFATGIENSYPTIAGGRRIDQMEKCGHYASWEHDFALTRELGLRALRWGPRISRARRAGPLRLVFRRRPAPAPARARVEVIADLCHFGVP